MSHPRSVAPRQRPGTVTAGALLTWIGAGFLIGVGLLVVIAEVTDAQPLTRALTEAIGLGVSVPAGIPLLTVGLVQLGVGVLLALLTVAAFTGSRGGLIGLTAAAGLYVLLAFAALGSDHASPTLLFGILWVGGVTVLFWVRRQWFAARHEEDERPGDAAEAVRRPGTVIAGAVMAWLAGGAVLVSGVSVMWSDFSEYLSANPSSFLLGLGLHLGLIIAAVGAVFLVLATVAFRGSMDTLVALTTLSGVCAFLLLTTILSGGGSRPVPALSVGAIAWLVTAVVLLWSGLGWYRSQRR